MKQQMIADGGMQYVLQITALEQVVYLDFDGELTDYNGEILTVNDVEVADSGLGTERIEKIVSALNKKYASLNVRFVTEIPESTEYSTIYVGITSAFDEYGNYIGLAENIDEGNKNKTDKAFVMLDSASSDEFIINTVSHETEHLLGILSHNGEGLDKYAATYYYFNRTFDGIVKDFENVGIYYDEYAEDYVDYDSDDPDYYHYNTFAGTVGQYGSVRVFSGGAANEAIVNGGSLKIEDDGTASNIVVSNGIMNISKGGSAEEVQVKAGGEVIAHYGTVIYDVCISNGGFMDIRGEVENIDGYYYGGQGAGRGVTVLEGGSLTIGGSALDLVVSSGGKAETDYLFELNMTWAEMGEVGDWYDEPEFWALPGTVYNAEIKSGANFSVAAGSVLNNDIVFGGTVTLEGSTSVYGDVTFDITEREAADSYIVDDLSALRGEISYSVLVTPDMQEGTYKLASGNFDVDSRKEVLTSITVRDAEDIYGVADSSGLIYGDYIYVLDSQNMQLALTISKYNPIIGCKQYYVETFVDGNMVSSAVKMTDKTLVGGGEDEMHIHRDGIAENVAVSSGGVVNMFGSQYCDDGAYFNFVGGNASDVVIHSSGEMYITAEAAASNVIVNSGGYLRLYETMEFNATWGENPEYAEQLQLDEFIFGYGHAVNLTVHSGGVVEADGKSVFSGDIILGGTVTLKGALDAQAADVVFDLSCRSVTDSYIVNNISFLDARSFSITVAENQALGMYKLAGNAANFNRTITIGNVNLAVGQNSVTVGKYDYSLVVNNSILYLSVKAASNTGNKVKVYDDDELKKQADVMTGEVLNAAGNNSMHVSKGGIAKNTFADSKTYIYISSGGITSNSFVSGGGEFVSSGGIASGTVLSSIPGEPKKHWTAGMQAVYSSGSAIDTVVGMTAVQYVYSGGTALNTVIESNGKVYYSSGAYASGVTVHAGGGFTVSIYGGDDETFLSGTNVKGTFKLENGVGSNLAIAGQWVSLFENGNIYATQPNVICVSNGGIVSKTTIFNRATLLVYSGGVAYDTVLENGGFRVNSSGIAYRTVVDGGWFCVESYGVANSNTVINNGGMYVSSAGVANSTTVNNGKIDVDSCGTLNEFTLHRNGQMTVSGGAIFTGTHIYGGNVTVNTEKVSNIDASGADIVIALDERSVSDDYIFVGLQALKNAKSFTVNVAENQVEGTYKLALNADGFDRSFTVKCGDIVYGTLNAGQKISYRNAEYALVDIGTSLFVSVTYQNWTEITPDKCFSQAVETFSNNQLTSMSQIMLNKDLTAWGDDIMHIHHDGIASETTADADTEIRIFKDGLAKDTEINGGDMHISEGGIASNTVLNAGNLYISAGGVDRNGTVEYDGCVYVYGNGTLDKAAVNGMVFISGGLMQDTEIQQDGLVYISAGGIAENTNMYGGEIHVSKNAGMEYTEMYDGLVNVSNGAVSDIMNVRGGEYRVCGGAADNTVIYDNGIMKVFKAGRASNTRLEGGELNLKDGSLHTGTLYIDNDAEVNAEQGSEINFDLTARTPSDDYIINNIALVKGTPSYTVTLNENQQYGTYVLAHGAAAFNTTLTLSTPSVFYSQISVGTTITVNSSQYELAVDNSGRLLLSISQYVPDLYPPAYFSYDLIQDGGYGFTGVIQAQDNITGAEDLKYYIAYSLNEYELEAGSGKTPGLTFSLTPDYAEKYIYYRIWVEDESGNISKTPIGKKQVIDNTDPVLTGEIDVNISDNKLLIDWQDASDNVKVAGYEVTVNGETFIVNTSEWTYNIIGSIHDFDISVIAFDPRGNRSNVLSTQYTAEGLTDILPTAVWVTCDGKQTGSVQVDDKFFVHINIDNISNTASGPCQGTVTCAGLVLATFAIPSIEAGQKTPSYIEVPIDPYQLATGTHDLVIKVDSNDAVTESNEINNEYKYSISVESEEYCDLVIGSLTVKKGKCTSGLQGPYMPGGIVLERETAVTPEDDVSIYFSVKNIGADFYGATKVHIFNGQQLLDTMDVFVPVLGNEYGYYIAPGTLQNGINDITVVVDYENKITEVSDNNNSATAQIEVGGGDLIVSNIGTDKAVYKLNETINFSFAVSNIEAIDITETTTSTVSINDTMWCLRSTAPVAGNSVVYDNFTINASELGIGTHTFVVNANILFGAVQEIDYSNNTSKKVTITIVEESFVKDTEKPVPGQMSVEQLSGTYDFVVHPSGSDNQTAAEKLKYRVRYADSADKIVSAKWQDSMNFQLAENNAAQTWYYQVEVTDEAGLSAESQIGSFTVKDITAPVFIYHTFDQQTYEISWSVFDNFRISGYILNINGNQIYSQSFTANSASSRVSDVFDVSSMNGSTFTYSITAVDFEGNQVSTSDITVKMNDVTAPVIHDWNLEKVTVDSYDYVLKYINASDNIDAFEDLTIQIQYAFNADDVESAPKQGISFSLAPEQAGQDMYYRVIVFDRAGNSSASEIRKVYVDDITPPEIPQNLTVSVNGRDALLDWDPAADNVKTAGYSIRYRNAGTMTYSTITVNTDSKTLTNLAPGRYYYQIAAYDAAGNYSPWSGVETFRVFAADPYENNDTVQTAYSLGTLDGTKTFEDGVISTAGDLDHFSFSMKTRGTAGDNISLSYDHSEGQLGLSLCRVGSTAVIRSSDESGVISLEGLTKGDYYICISGINGSLNSYDLSYTKVNGIAEDQFEENDSLESASVINIGAAVEGSYQLTIDLENGADVDYFKISLEHPSASGDYIKIDSIAANGDLDLYLLDSKGNEIKRSATSKNTEGISLSGLSAGNYYIKVQGANSSVSNNYTLSWKILPAEVAADRYEGSEPIELNGKMTISDLTVSKNSRNADRQDTFVFTIHDGASGGQIRFEDNDSVWLRHGLAWQIIDENGNPVTSGNGYQISLSQLAAGQYTLTVDTPKNGLYGAYSLVADIPEPAVSNPNGGQGGNQSGSASEKKKAKNAVLMYIGADNNAHNFAMSDLKQFASGYHNDSVDIYVLADRSSDPEYQNYMYRGYENWSDTRVGKMDHNEFIVNDWLSWGELDTGNIETLKKFIDWGMAQTDAEQYTLIILGHGNAAGNVSTDDTSDSFMKISEISSLLKTYDNIPVVMFESCCFGSDKVITEMAGACEYLIASEAVFYSGYNTINWWYFAELLKADMSAEEIANLFIDAANPDLYVNHRSEWMRYEDHTLAAYNVGEYVLADALNEFGAHTEEFENADWRSMAIAFKNAVNYASIYSSVNLYVSDLGQILYNLLDMNISNDLEDAINDLLADISDIVIAQKSVPAYYGSCFSVFNPITSDEEAMEIYVNQKIPHENFDEWIDFLEKLASQKVFAENIARAATFSMSLVCDDTIIAENLGIFSGSGISFDGLNVIGSSWYTVTVDGTVGENDRIICTAAAENAVLDAVLYDENMNVLWQGDAAEIILSGNIPENGEYIIQVSANIETAIDVAFEADWTSGTDRFDYAGSTANMPDVNGNSCIEKATELACGIYTGLASYAGDSDYYSFLETQSDVLQIKVNGRNLILKEYDADGKLLQTVENRSSDSCIISVEAGSFLAVEGIYSLSEGVSSYSMDIMPAPEKLELQSSANRISWDKTAELDKITVELSIDDFNSVLKFTTGDSGADIFGYSGKIDWRLAGYNSDKNFGEDTLYADSDNANPIKYVSETNNFKDVFFASGNKQWGNYFCADYVGAVMLEEKVMLKGKNRIEDVFAGSEDANILVMTDDKNGDALFVDDVFSAFGEQSRLSSIDEIRAGAGDDIIDMTSQKFEYTGGGMKIYGGLGDDVIWVNNGSNVIFGDAGNDRIIGGGDDDIIVGGSGNDSMHGGGGNDKLVFGGDFGNDIVEQLTNGKVTLYFDAAEEEVKIDGRTYSVGENSVTLQGDFDVEVFYGTDKTLASIGAYDDFASEKIFEDKVLIA
ncbi:MAG: AIDA repeat-containing protein [Lentisphaeria bacterium]|nr:AIDA repeat-containing protein [Lentisphaeria bacterium]